MHSNYCSCVISVSLYKSSRESIRTEHPLSLCSVSNTDRRDQPFLVLFLLISSLLVLVISQNQRQISPKVFHFSSTTTIITPTTLHNFSLFIFTIRDISLSLSFTSIYSSFTAFITKYI
ncbi:hypothetical protein V8G54_025459 [Vigna mungo]|uniref:Uncharacterized protein n=1 Tax=Vigna mungo TaxID=3915 RepID=A0AAQ3MZ20_VIGMU